MGQPRMHTPLRSTCRQLQRVPTALRIAILGVVGILMFTQAPHADARDARELSMQELADLRAGKLVLRREVRRVQGVPWHGGMAWQLIHRSADDVYRALGDIQTYPAYLPAAKDVQLVTEGPPQLLFVKHQLGPVHASYYVLVSRDPARRSLRFRLDRERPASIRNAWGELQVTPYGEDRSVVSYVISADLGEGLGIGLIRSEVHHWMMRVPELLRRQLEKRAPGS